MPKFRNIFLFVVNIFLYTYLVNKLSATPEYFTYFTSILPNKVEQKAFVDVDSSSLSTEKEQNTEVSYSNINSPVKSTATPKAIATSVETVTLEMESESMQKVATVNLRETIETPTAIQIILSYDPNKITVSQVEVGNIWSHANILKNVINNDAGRLEIAAGQGFGATTMAGNTLLTVTYTTALSGVPFTISPESKFAYSGKDNLVTVNSSIATIVVK